MANPLRSFCQSVTAGSLLLCFMSPAFSSTIAPTQTAGSYFNEPLKLVATADEDVVVAPRLQIPAAHQGKSAELYVLAIDNSVGMWLVRTPDNWEFFSGALPTMATVTLGETQPFDIYQGPLPIMGLDFIYGYRLNDGSTVSYNSSGFRLTVSETAKKLQDALDREMQAAATADVVEGVGIPGTMMAVKIPGEGLWFGGSGMADREAQIPMKDKLHARYWIGSGTKTFTAMLILQLVEEGKLSLDDTVEKWLPGRIPNGGGDKVTIRFLLNHTSGIGNFAEGSVDAWTVPLYTNGTKQWTPNELLDVTLQYTFASKNSPGFAATPFSFGETWIYSNTNYVLLGLIAEKIAGTSWEAQIRQRFIEPLGLKNTLVPIAGEVVIPGDHIIGYWNLWKLTFGNLGENKLVPMAAIDPSFSWASGDMISTLDDMMIWMEAISTGKLLKYSTEKQQFNWIMASHGLYTGLGIYENDAGLREHLGSLGGFVSLNQYDWDTGAVMVGVQTAKVGTIHIHRKVFSEVMLNPLSSH